MAIMREKKRDRDREEERQRKREKVLNVENVVKLEQECKIVQMLWKKV
jgi:hypothetical protein